MLWCVEWVTVLDAALVVRASKRQELSWIWGKEEEEGGERVGKKIKGMGRMEMRERKRKKMFDKSFITDFPGRALDQYSSFLGLEISVQEKKKKEEVTWSVFMSTHNLHLETLFITYPTTNPESLNSHKQGFGKHQLWENTASTHQAHTRHATATQKLSSRVQSGEAIGYMELHSWTICCLTAQIPTTLLANRHNSERCRTAGTGPRSTL